VNTYIGQVDARLECTLYGICTGDDEICIVYLENVASG
jgi:hypothetical protein